MTGTIKCWNRWFRDGLRTETRKKFSSLFEKEELEEGREEKC